MNIKEIITFYVNETSNTLEVSFRLENDAEDEFREDFIELQEVKNFGYNFSKNKNIPEIFEEEEFDNFLMVDDESTEEVDYSEVMSFINEYYLIFPDKLPSPSLF